MVRFKMRSYVLNYFWMAWSVVSSSKQSIKLENDEIGLDIDYTIFSMS